MKDKLISTKYEGVYYKELNKLFNGKPDISYYIMYRSNGKQIKKAVGKKSIRMTGAKAYQKRQDVLYEIKHGINTHTTKEITFEKLIDKWYEDKKTTLKSIKEDYQRLKYHASNILSKNISNITSNDIKTIYNTINDRGLSEQTFKRVFSMYKRVINHSLEHEYIKTAPNVRFNKSIKNNEVTEIYTDDMIHRYINVIQNYQDTTIARIVMLILNTGMRRSEPIKIKWTNYSYEHSTVIIEDAKSGQNETYLLSDKAKEIIESQRGFTQIYIFEDYNRQPIKKSKLSYHASRMKLLAGLPEHFRPLHSLRHRFGTELAKSGLNAFKIQRMMTHKDIKTTQRYIDLAEQELLDDLNKVEQNSNIGSIDTNVKSKIIKIEVNKKQST